MHLVGRLMAVVVGVPALVGVMTPPANATTVIETTLIGTMQVHGGLGYPVVTLGVTVPGVSCLDPLPSGDPVPNCHPVYDHQRSIFMGSTTVCQDGATNTLKQGKALVHTGACSFGASGVVTGHCGLAGAQMSGTYVDSLGQAYDLSVHLTSVEHRWTLVGHVTKRSTGRSGKITGEIWYTPEQSPPGGPSCTNKTQERFIIGGETVIVIPTL